MYAVGRLGSYISRGVYTVSGPFHPFGGAVDIIVVEQPDGSFRSSPWYVKFGKFQGVLKAKEKIVKIDVNGVDVGFHMYLDHKGEAYFLKEVDGEEDCVDSNAYPSSSSDEASDGQSQSVVKGRRLMKSQTFDVDATVMGQMDSGEGRIVPRVNSRRSRILGFDFGRRSMKDEIFRAEEKGLGRDVGRVDSLERAEIAADLLELKWSKSLTTKKYRKDGTSRFSTPRDVRYMKDGADISVKYESSRRDSGDVPTEVAADCHTEFSVVAGENRTGFCESSSSLHPGLRGLNEEHREVRHKTTLVQDEAASKDSTVIELDTTYRETQEVILLNSLKDDQNEYRGDLITRDAGRGNNQLKLESVGNLESSFCNGDLSKPASSPSSESSEEVQFQFTDIDDLNTRKKITVNRYPQVLVNGEETNMCLQKFNEKHSSDNSEDDDDKVISTPIDISKLNEAVGDDEDVSCLAESMPPMRSQIESIDHCLIQAPLSQSLDMDNKHLDLLIPAKGHESPQKTKETLDQEHLHKSGNEEILHEDLSRVMNPANGGWRLWPFSFKRSRSGKVMQDTSISSADIMEKSMERCVSSNKFFLKPKPGKKIVRSITPTSELLASLNLKEGSNSVAFTFSTAMLGDQQVDARIYLWKWNTRIIISDVDGTITKSDVLGQFMPLVGMDWSQTGVAHLYNAIKENGYQLLFLSARAISQAYHTRRFLLNLKQDGKGLPDGPVVISPDGLFPSLFREVIRRAPHEFKIACLEDIKALFPPDSNPFYAGFGNRITDEISYLKVGIPKGKIFTINPRGEVVVNKHVNTKSYASLHALVHGMFPPTAKSEQEDFNSWNYWKLPPPDIDI